MSALAASPRVGWCPGALRPMTSRDGLIVRVKPRGATLTAEQGIGIAAAAARFGSGALELTSRANLQIRGVGETALPGLTAALDGLGLLDPSSEVEARRNVVVSPMAGLDPSAAFDIRPGVAALEAGLAAAEQLTGLPAKFGFAVSDGGRWRLDDVSADVRFEAQRDTAGRPSFTVRLDGDAEAVADCVAEEIGLVAVRLARAFVEASVRASETYRMRHLVARSGAEAVLAQAGLVGSSVRTTVRELAIRGVGIIPLAAGDLDVPGALGSSLRAERCNPDATGAAATEEDLCPSLLRRGSAGLLRSARKDGAGEGGDRVILGVGAPFGRLDAAALDLLARGAPELRLTPWRAILLPGLGSAAAERLVAGCEGIGLIVDPADPRLRIAACAGAPGCRRGSTATLADAARWARLVRPGRGIALHVSGCVKGCAHPGSVPLTLVARDGRYDAVLDGRPGDGPAFRALDAETVRRLVQAGVGRDAPP